MAEICSKAKKLKAGLYVVATPIGNLGDCTVRMTETLASADLIACEDTRVTAKLLTHLAVSTPTMAYHEHSGPHVRSKLITKIQDGAAIALVSDAGTPLISDPGYKLVEDVYNLNIPVFAIPGPSAVTTALSIAGLPTDRFIFLGFAPNKSSARTKWFTNEAKTNATLAYYESTRRLPDSLADAAAVFNGRQVAVCRELTKKFEDVIRGEISDLAKHYSEIGAPKGECVVIIGPPAKQGNNQAAALESDELLKHALKYLRVKDAAKLVHEITGVPKNALYKAALAITDHDKDQNE